ncbi:hypothetical protein ACA910_003358 [Epithemia clementina (nom. ined.)]
MMIKAEITTPLLQELVPHQEEPRSTHVSCCSISFFATNERRSRRRQDQLLLHQVQEEEQISSSHDSWEEETRTRRQQPFFFNKFYDFSSSPVFGIMVVLFLVKFCIINLFCLAAVFHKDNAQEMAHWQTLLLLPEDDDDEDESEHRSTQEGDPQEEEEQEEQEEEQEQEQDQEQDLVFLGTVSCGTKNNKTNPTSRNTNGSNHDYPNDDEEVAHNHHNQEAKHADGGCLVARADSEKEDEFVRNDESKRSSMATSTPPMFHRMDFVAATILGMCITAFFIEMATNHFMVVV